MPTHTAASLDHLAGADRN